MTKWKFPEYIATAYACGINNDVATACTCGIDNNVATYLAHSNNRTRFVDGDGSRAYSAKISFFIFLCA